MKKENLFHLKYSPVLTTFSLLVHLYIPEHYFSGDVVYLRKVSAQAASDILYQ